jgi:hypothetical protein
MKNVFNFIIFLIITSESFSQEPARLLHSNFKDSSFIEAMNKMHKNDSSFKVTNVFNCDYDQYRYIIKVKVDDRHKKFVFKYNESIYLPAPIKLKNYVEALFNRNIKKADFKKWNKNLVTELLITNIATTCSLSFKIRDSLGLNKRDSLFWEKSLDLSGKGNVEQYINDEIKYIKHPLNFPTITILFGKIKD